MDRFWKMRRIEDVDSVLSEMWLGRWKWSIFAESKLYFEFENWTFSDWFCDGLFSFEVYVGWNYEMNVGIYFPVRSYSAL